MVLDHVFFQRGFVLEGGGTLRAGEHVINVNLKRKIINFYPYVVLDHVFFQRGFVLEGGGTLRAGEHVIHMNLKRKKSIFNTMRCLTTCSFSEVLFLKEVRHWEQVNK